MIHWEEPAPHVGLAILDRPERRNALNAEQCDALRGHLEANHHLRAIVFAGEGTSFCAGADIVRRTAEHTGLAHGKEDSFRPAFELLCDEIEHHPAPIIAAVHGPAIGAGTQLVVACDFRVAGPDAVFGIPASKLGIVLSPANVRRLVQLVGHHNARTCSSRAGTSTATRRTGSVSSRATSTTPAAARSRSPPRSPRSRRSRCRRTSGR